MNVHGFKKGIICVERSVNGNVEWLAVPQHQYKEWAGCFSIWEA